MYLFVNILNAVDRQKLKILFTAVLSIVAAGSFTTLAGLLTTRLVDEFGWSTQVIGIGVATNMILYGLTAPFAIHLMRQYGIARISILALWLLIGGSVLTLNANIVVFTLAWGLLIGMGTGCLTMAYGALIARIWFSQSMGTVAGILTASAVVGQFALLPLWAELAERYDWRAPIIGCALLSVAAIMANIFLMSNAQERESESQSSVTPAAGTDSLFDVLRVLSKVAKSSAFWILVTLFIICGATTNGLMWSHFTPAVCRAGMAPTAASGILFIIGVFNIFGTISAGWLSDRISPKHILAFVFLARAGTLFWLPVIIASGFDYRITMFGVLFGILDVATVPPVIKLCNQVFGRNGPEAFGWINAFHQLGAGAMALSGGIINAVYGTYDPIWILSGIFCVSAVVFVYLHRYDAYHESMSQQPMN